MRELHFSISPWITLLVLTTVVLCRVQKEMWLLLWLLQSLTS